MVIIILILAPLLKLISELDEKPLWIAASKSTLLFSWLLIALPIIYSTVSLISDIYVHSQASSQVSHLDLPQLGEYVARVTIEYQLKTFYSLFTTLLSLPAHIAFYLAYRWISRVGDKYISYYYVYSPSLTST
jgi:hypothetical protein